MIFDDILPRCRKHSI